MKIALAQIDIQTACPDTMFLKIEEFVNRASTQDVDIIAFPEMVFGYLVGDLWLDNDWCYWLMSFNDKIRELSRQYHIGIIYGNVYLADNIQPTLEDKNKGWRFCNNDGRAIRFNAAYAVQNGITVERKAKSKYIPIGIQPKTLLPNYRYFDDKRYFMSVWDFVSTYMGEYEEVNSPFIFDINGEPHLVGVELCEDMWWKDYNINPSFALSEAGSEVIINISASPWTFNKNRTRDKRVAELLNWDEVTCRDLSTLAKDGKEYLPKGYERIRRFPIPQVKTPKFPPFAYVNCVGAQNNGKNILVFDGASTVYGRDGKPKILANADYEEELLIFDPEDIPQQTAIRKKEYSIPRKYQAIIRGIRHMSEVTGVEKYIIGISGGIDSAVVATLLVDALGKKNVFAINMPTKYNSRQTKNAAKTIATRLGISYKIIPIEEIITNEIQLVKMGVNTVELKSLTYENIQAKIRGILLSDIAGEMGAFFSCNGNKIEVFTGYATLYGDWSGALAPIADLTKEEVYGMAEYLNEVHKKRPIPKKLINGNIKSGPELKEKQATPIKIGYHCAVVRQIMDYQKITASTLMQWWLDGVLAEKLQISPKLITKYGMDNGKEFVEDLKWLFSRMRAAVFKRVQSVPIIVLTKTAFGYDLREAILPKFQWADKSKILEEKILGTNSKTT